MLISLEDLKMGRFPNPGDLDAEREANAKIVVERVNAFFDGYVWPLKKRVNDGIRRPGIDTPKNSATHSTHNDGKAVDLDDDDNGTIWHDWVLPNFSRLKELGLWMEHPCWTHCDGMSWLHFQIVPPLSGNRVYVPSTRPNPHPAFWDGKYPSSENGKDQP